MKLKFFSFSLILFLLCAFILPIFPIHIGEMSNFFIVHAASEVMEEPELLTINGNYNTLTFLVTMGMVFILLIVFVIVLIRYFKKR